MKCTLRGVLAFTAFIVAGPQRGDLNGDGVVDLRDMAILGRHWLDEP
ncbi:MAG: dockerin type I domain-containing protein [Solirubrobacterales bacterium]